jgi:hypothetical protein
LGRRLISIVAGWLADILDVRTAALLVAGCAGAMAALSFRLRETKVMRQADDLEAALPSRPSAAVASIPLSAAALKAMAKLLCTSPPILLPQAISQERPSKLCHANNRLEAPFNEPYSVLTSNQDIRTILDRKHPAHHREHAGCVTQSKGEY